MRKVQLNVAELTVESLGIAPADAEKGTVLGQAVSINTACYTCPGWVTGTPRQVCQYC